MAILSQPTKSIRIASTHPMQIRNGYTFLTSTPNKEETSQAVLSILIPNYNGKGILEEAIKSIINQDFPHPIEIIVHDDHSTDGSPLIILNEYPMVTLLQSSENVGFCRANNRMAEHGKGRYFLLLNNDAALLADALWIMLKTCQAQSPEGIVSVPQFRADTGELVDYGYNLDPFLNPIPQMHPDSQIAMVIGACLWLPSNLWRKLEGFPEWFQTNAEDMYLCLAAQFCGHPVQSSAFSGYKHWIGKTLGGGKSDDTNRLNTTLKRRALSERNKNFVMLCCYPSIFILTIFPLHALLLTLEGLLLSIIKKDFRILSQIYLPSLVECWKNKANITAKRKLIHHKKAKNGKLKGFKLTSQKIKLLIKHGVPSIKK
jgi:GT2 family glycosyltransferase